MDLERAGDYIAAESPAAADATLDRIRRAAARLAIHPAMGRTGRASGTRELVVSGTPYVLGYRIRDDRVEIMRVVHGAQRWPRDL